MGLDLGASELAIGSLALGAVGTGVQMLGQMQAAKAQEAEARYQSQVAANNALIAGQNAQYAAQAGAANAQQVSLENAERQAQIRASMAANNIDVNTGSAADVRKSQREIGDLSTLNEVQKAALQQYGYQTQATNFQAESGLQSAKASNASSAGLIGAAGSLLQGGSSITGRYSWMQQNGIDPLGLGPSSSASGTGGLYP